MVAKWLCESLWFVIKVCAPTEENVFTKFLDKLAKLGIGLFLIIPAALYWYGNTYYTLKEPAKSTLGKRSAFVLRESNFAPNKSVFADAENCIITAEYVENMSSNSSPNSFAETEDVED